MKNLSRLEKFCAAGLCAAVFAAFGVYRQNSANDEYENETRRRSAESAEWMKRAEEDYITRKLEADRLEAETRREVDRIHAQGALDKIQRDIEAQRNKIMWDKKLLEATRKRLAAEEELRRAVYGD